MSIIFLVNILVPLAAGLTYFLMAAEIKRVSKVRKIIFGEVGHNKAFSAFLLFGIYLASRPLQNIVGPHPWPMLINSARQFFLMAIIAPSILVGILHWVPSRKATPKSAVLAAFSVGILMALIFTLVNSIAIDGSKLLASFGPVNIYDANWFTAELCNAYGVPKTKLITIHLMVQMVSPVGYFLLAAAYVKHRRYNYPLSSVYNQVPLKWKYLESGLLIFAFSMIFAGLVAFFGYYYTYLWVIYFLGAIISGIMGLIGVKIPPASPPDDLN